MTDPKREDESLSAPAQALGPKSDGSPVNESAGSVANSSAPDDSAPKLTAEEQMALYEAYLKENDWGHQPC